MTHLQSHRPTKRLRRTALGWGGDVVLLSCPLSCRCSSVVSSVLSWAGVTARSLLAWQPVCGVGDGEGAVVWGHNLLPSSGALTLGVKLIPAAGYMTMSSSASTCCDVKGPKQWCTLGDVVEGPVCACTHRGAQRHNGGWVGNRGDALT